MVDMGFCRERNATHIVTREQWVGISEGSHCFGNQSRGAFDEEDIDIFRKISS